MDWRSKGLKLAGASDSDVDSLVGGLRFLKEMSIKKKVQRFVHDALTRQGSSEAAALAKKAMDIYDDRSKLVHEGSLPAERLDKAIGDLRDIMKRVLTACYLAVAT